jgi:integrase
MSVLIVGRLCFSFARRFPLWPETVAALHSVLPNRSVPKEKADAGLLFMTKYGGRWAKAVFEATEKVDQATEQRMSNAIGKELAKLFAVANVTHKKGRSFYTLRHVFEIVAVESRDQVAVDHIMGHARDDMASIYRERVGDQ